MKGLLRTWNVIGRSSLAGKIRDGELKSAPQVQGQACSAIDVTLPQRRKRLAPKVVPPLDMFDIAVEEPISVGM